MKLHIKNFLLLLLLSVTVNGQNNPQLIHPEWSKNSTIYEVNIRQYTPEGTFKAFEKHLPELMKLGVDIIWLMPINPIGKLNRKGTLGSYYSVSNYTEVNPEFGTIADFKRLIEKAHKMDMRIIIDWVANHTAWDNVWVKNYKDFFTMDPKGNFVPPIVDWSDVIDLNYDNKELWKYMIEAMAFWVKECNIDGFRCDVAAMVPTEFWVEAYSKLSKIKHVFMLAEANENYLHKTFDMTYNWPLKDLMNQIATGKKNGADLIEFFEKEKKEYTANDIRMNFTSNHDENTWNGTEFERLGDGAKTFAVLCGVVPGMPLMYSGQEAGLNKRLRFFEKDTIEWKADSMREIYTKLNNLKRINKALWNGEAGAELVPINTFNQDVFAFTRTKNSSKVFALFNFSNKPQQIKLNSDLINGNYIELFSNKKIIISNNQFEVSLQPWEYLLYTK